MDLKRKLARLGPPVAAGREEPPPVAPAVDESARHERIARLRELIAKKSGTPREAVPRPTVCLAGERLVTDDGPLHRIARYLEPGHHHGHTPIVRSLGVSAKTLAALALDPDLERIDPRRLLFVDTETTGLAGGTGTIPFLVGLAWFEDESLCVEQLLLHRPGEERPLLRRLAERLDGASAIVTYNGKSFDWPLVRTRAVLNRVPIQVPSAHIDLLHCARRVFGPRLKAARLVHMEEHVLGLRREGDIEGAEIPTRFWDYVRGGDESLLAPVVEHNANDLVALAALVVALAERWDGVLPHHEPEDRLAVAKIAFRFGDHPRALERARSAASAGGDSELTTEALVLGARAAQRTADPVVQEAMLLEALGYAHGDMRAGIHLALAKLYEHGLRDYSRALAHLEQSEGAEDSDRRERRRSRLHAKRDRRGAD